LDEDHRKLPKEYQVVEMVTSGQQMHLEVPDVVAASIGRDSGIGAERDAVVTSG